MDNEYWLQQWIQEYEIKSIDDYRRAIKSPTAVKSLYDKNLLGGVIEEKHKAPLDSNTVMAGRSLDLSSSFHHHCFTCLKTELGTVVTRTAHYFQRVAVSGPVTSIIKAGLQNKDKQHRERTLHDLRAHVALLLHINEIGAHDRVTFVPKPSRYCRSCYQDFAREAGFDIIHDEQQSRDLIQKIVETSEFVTMRNRKGNWESKISGPMVTRSVWTKEFGRSRPTRKQSRRPL